MHLKVGEFTHWCARTTKLQIVAFQSNSGRSGQSKYVNRRENSKESSACSKRDRGKMLRSRDMKPARYVTHFAFLCMNQRLQTWAFPLFKRSTISATGSDVLEALTASSRKKIGRPGIMEMKMASGFRGAVQVQR